MYIYNIYLYIHTDGIYVINNTYVYIYIYIRFYTFGVKFDEPVLAKPVWHFSSFYSNTLSTLFYSNTPSTVFCPWRW